MELVYTCKGCNKDRILDSDSKTREELVSETGGSKFEVNCPFCKKNTVIDVNHVNAVKTSSEQWMPYIVYFGTCIFLLLFFAKQFQIFLLIIPLLIAIIISTSIQSKVKLFNANRIYDNNTK